MIKFNVSEGKKWLDQRDNEILPHATCNTTSMVMMLNYTGIELPKGCEWAQAEDSLTHFTRTNDDVDAFYQRTDRPNWQRWRENTRDAIPPNQYHAVLNFATNRWVGRDVTQFTTARSIQQILLDLIEGKASVVSGIFAGLRHVVTVVGFTTVQARLKERGGLTPQLINVGSVNSIIIDDPYGDYRTNYKERNGNDIEIPYKEFINITNTARSTSKWCHFIR